jgi:ribosomal-protein-alanine N-acetyltransferase
MLTIRQGYNPEDTARLYEIEKICFSRVFRWSKEDLVDALKTMDVWIGEDEGQIVGYTVCDVEDGVVHIVTLEIAPEFRRKGFGEALMGAAETYYLKKGIKKMKLEVHTDNPAQILYFKLGYRVVGVQEGYYSNGSMAIVMTKTLKKVCAS